MRSALLWAATLLAATTLAARPAAAQNTYQQQIIRQLAAHSENPRQHGYSADRGPIFGQLNDNASDQMRVNLRGGVRYAIIGVCDEDCTDIDLRLYAPDGTKLDEDIALDDYPTLEFVAPVTGQYRLSVEMATCNTNPCYWGVQIYAR
jgi:hypothetical protein